MKKAAFLFLCCFCFGGLLPLFSQQKVDVNGDGFSETVYSRPGKKYFYKIEFDFNKDGKNDVILLLDENTGRYLSLDIVRTTWPIPSGIGTQQWIDNKKAAGQEFWRNRNQNDASCDICNGGLDRNAGYVLSSQDILANLKYVNYHVYYARHDPLTALFLGEDYDKVSASLSQMETMFLSSINTPWLLCNDCIQEWITLRQ